MAKNISNIVDSLKKLSESKKTKFTLPCVKFDVEILPFNAKHISQINSSFLASSNDGTHAIKFTSLLKSLLNDILILPEGKTYKDFNIIDMHFIVFKIRELLNPTFELEVTDRENEEVNITEHLKSKKFSKIKTSKTVGRKNCKVTLELPSFEKNFTHNQIIEAAHKKISRQDEPNLEQLSQEIFSWTLLNFLKSITLVIENEPQEFSFENETSTNQLQILNLIPKEEYNKMFEAIEELSEPITELLTTKENNKISLDHSLFIE